MKYFKITIGILTVLAASRFIPHPPNFTSAIALSFYVPAIFGLKFIPAVIIAFIITDFFIGFHSVTPFTWGAIILIGFLTKYFKGLIIKRIPGALLGALLFYIISNFGVWSLGSYGYSVEGLIACYTFALPFFGYTLVSTLFFSFIIEIILNQKTISKKLIN
tara:strand:+ start:73 stop:558 length:486 start_codon:yes stop_codon:yes gene_type:complete